MRIQYTYQLKDPDSFKKALLQYSKSTDHVCILDSCSFKDKKYEYLAAIGVKDLINLDADEKDFQDLKEWNRKNQDWKFGFFSYDLKNQFEHLTSENSDEIQFGLCTFFIPEYVLSISGNQLVIWYASNQPEREVVQWVNEIEALPLAEDQHSSFVPQASMTEDEYIQKVNEILHHIQQGDIYEMNFCQEFSISDCEIDPNVLFSRLINHSPAPQSTFLKIHQHSLISASPERYLWKQGDHVISQPMKGTAQRSSNSEIDKKLKEQLGNNQKERSENVMIVDLVRNDLSRTATKDSVKVDELYGLYTFPQVHQMISTISANLEPTKDILDVVETSFPMGSMTGAPKIRAMKLIDKYENKSRGIFSGSVGYIDEQGDADFNVVIRSMMYNQEKKHLSFQVGGAITANSDPKQEFEECMLKAKALINVLTNA